MNNYTSPPNGMLVFNTTNNQFFYNAGTTETPNWISLFQPGLITKTISSGSLNDINIINTKMIIFTGYTCSFTITGFAGGYDGQVLYVVNGSNGAKMNVSFDSPNSAEGNRIYGSSTLFTGNQWSGLTFVYSTTNNHWILVGIAN